MLKVGNAALAFYEVGKKEYLANIGNIASNPENCFYRLLPAIVNLAFSIELSFKTFINEDDAKKCKHDLQKLFEKVGSPVKDVLMAAVISQMQHHDATFNEKTFGEYLMPQSDRKLLKAIHKSTSLNKYNQAILVFFNQR